MSLANANKRDRQVGRGQSGRRIQRGVQDPFTGGDLTLQQSHGKLDVVGLESDRRALRSSEPYPWRR